MKISRARICCLLTVMTFFFKATWLHSLVRNDILKATGCALRERYYHLKSTRTRHRICV